MIVVACFRAIAKDYLKYSLNKFAIDEDYPGIA